MMDLCGQRKVGIEIGQQVGLKFCQISIQGSLTSEGNSDGKHDLANKEVKVRVGQAFHTEVSMTDFRDDLIVHHESTITASG